MECRAFMNYLVQFTSEEKASNYSEAKFVDLFQKYDEDKNGLIYKSEMAVFITQVFKNY
jgi:Ca2+-binding EF-hand superfamily protein